MNFSDLLVDSVSYPFTDVKKYLQVLFLFLTSFLIVPGIIACGYLLRIIEFTTHGKQERPDFSDLKMLLIYGLRFLALGVVFGMIFYGLLWMLQSFLAPYIALDYALAAVLAAVFTIIVNLAYIMCLAHMAHEKRFTAAFEFKKIYGFMSEVGWAKYLVLVTIFTLFGELLSQLIALISAYTTLPLALGNINIVVAIVVFTYLFMFESRFTGLIYPEQVEKNIKEI